MVWKVIGYIGMDFMVWSRSKEEYWKLRLFGDGYVDVKEVGVCFKVIFGVKGFLVFDEIKSFRV